MLGAVIARVNRAGRVEWCLPKGHLEGEETPEQAAVREIAEETGIEGRVLTALGIIDYWFAVEGRRVHKRVHHYLLEATGGALSIEGDPDREAIEAAWVPLQELTGLLAFPNERRIAREASAYLADSA
jgi:8-oxo-dGTP pyrophosphatase MutT (NUDIX family)